jgi:hypothetical protein
MPNRDESCCGFASDRHTRNTNRVVRRRGRTSFVQNYLCDSELFVFLLIILVYRQNNEKVKKIISNIFPIPTNYWKLDTSSESSHSPLSENAISSFICRGLHEEVEEVGRSRKTAKTTADNLQIKGFQDIDPKTTTFAWNTPNITDPNISFKLGHRPSLLDIFLRFVPKELLDQIIKNFTTGDLLLRQSSGWVLVPTLRMVYIALAFSIRIIGLQNQPKENQRNQRPLRQSILEAKNHFCDQFPMYDPIGDDKLAKLLSLPYFTSSYYEEISHYFQSIIEKCGDVVAGDEKLFHFTGDSIDCRLVPTKPDRIGLWFYELCVPLRFSDGTKKSFLIWAKLHHSDRILAQHVPVSSIVESWVNVTKSVGYKDTVLVMDSYYLDKVGKAILAGSGVKYIAAITKNRFSQVYNYLSKKINRPGEWSAINNPETFESALYYWSYEKNVGKKLVYTNAFQITTEFPEEPQVPIFDHYKKSFSTCDTFNRALHDRTWPHKKGGRGVSGAPGKIHDFMLSVILQNTINVYLYTRKRFPEEYNFKHFCEVLSNDLYQYAHVTH